MRHHDGTGKENCCCLIFSLLWIIMAYIHCSVMTLKAYNSNNRKKNGPQFVTTFNLMLSHHGTFFMHPTLEANFASQGKNCGGSQKNPGFQGFRKFSVGYLAKKRLHVFVSQLGAWVSLSCSSSWAQFPEKKSGQNRKIRRNSSSNCSLFRNWIGFINTTINKIIIMWLELNFPFPIERKKNLLHTW